MPGLSGAAVFIFQQDDLTKRDIHWAMIFLAITALALVAQAAGVIVICMFGAKLLQKVNSIADLVEHKTGPILDRTNVILTELAPRVKSVGEQVEHISATVRDRVEQLSVTVGELNDTVREINGKTRVQVQRADNIVTDALQGAAEISHTVQNGIKGPVKQIAGVIAGVRAGIETLVARSPFGHRDPGPGSDI